MILSKVNEKLSTPEPGEMNARKSNACQDRSNTHIEITRWASVDASEIKWHHRNLR